MDRRFLFWWRWLVVATGIVFLFGLSLVVLPGLAQKAFNLLYFSSTQGNTEFAEDAVDYITFVCAVLGAVMCGWAITLLYAIFGPFRHRLIEGWRMVAVPMLVWFIPDTAFSLYSGFWQNAVLNTVLLVLFAIPLVATYKVFHPHR